MASERTAQIEILQSVPLFSAIGKKQLRRLAKQFTARTVDAGEVLTVQGEYGREFSAVVSGTARCEVDGSAVSTFGPGDCFGELALLAGGPRIATITAETPMELLVLDRSDFTTMLRAAPEVAVKLLRSVAARLQEAEQRVTN
jgi:CRP/FNR family transcriptional regulator, cyclic AMP receptor protein